ncbi:hypothetical protein F5X96DRAFT_453918 [Biscogniauxia mediterranea]|nr:hypothetical protein F5X96DRAFT_453918 [Biscogniauxia mediterranea]
MASSTTRLESPQQRTMPLNRAPHSKDDGEVASSSPHADLASTFPRLSTSNSTTLHRLYTANKAELTRHVSAAAGAQEYLWGGDDWFVRWYEAAPSPLPVDDDSYHGKNGEGDSPGLDADSHNLVEHQVLPWSVISDAVDMVVSRFAKQRRRFSWVVGPTEQPQLEAALRSRGLVLAEDEPVMVADLENCAPLDAKTETLSPLSPQEAARFRLRDYQMQLVRLEQLNRKRLKLAHALDTTQCPKPQSAAEAGRPIESRPASPTAQHHGSASGTAAPGNNNSVQAAAAAPETRSYGARPGRAASSSSTMNLVDVLPSSAPPPSASWPATTKPLRDGFEIRPVTDAAGVADWVRAWAARDDDNAPGVRHWTRVYSALLARLPSTQFQMFAAFRPSSSSSSSSSSSPAPSTSSPMRSSSNSNGAKQQHQRRGGGGGGGSGGGRHNKRPPPHVDDDPENGNYSSNNPVLGTGYVHSE